MDTVRKWFDSVSHCGCEKVVQRLVLFDYPKAYRFQWIDAEQWPGNALLRSLKGLKVPYFVFAIHTDNTDNRLYGQYENLVEADKKQRDMRDGNVHGDNYFVRMFFAESLEEAETKADVMRPRPKTTKL